MLLVRLDLFERILFANLDFKHISLLDCAHTIYYRCRCELFRRGLRWPRFRAY